MGQMEKWEQEKNCVGMLCDVRVRETVDHVMKGSIEHWGHIDVIAKYVRFLDLAFTIKLIFAPQLHRIWYVPFLSFAIANIKPLRRDWCM